MDRERRAGGELRALGGRRVAGVLLRFGDLARLPDGRSERFEPGSLDPIPATIPVNLQHDSAVQVGELALSGDREAIRAEGEVAAGVHALIRRRALGGLSVEFRATREREADAPVIGRRIRVIERGELLGAGVVDRPAYPRSGIEARQGEAALTLLEGPVGADKSGVLRELLDGGEVDVVADLTPLWAALRLIERDADGRYPEREDGDPALLMALYLKTVTVRRALADGLRVAVTTATPGQESKWRALADEVGAEFDVRTVDPGPAVIRDRLGDDDGVISEACLTAIARWYGEAGTRSLSALRRRVLAGAA